MAHPEQLLTRAERIAAEDARGRAMGLEAISLSELMKKAFPPTSEQRLEALAKGSWTPQEFVTATRAFVEHSGLTLVVARSAPELVGDWGAMRFSYRQLDGCRARLEAGDLLLVALVVEAGNVIGYGYAEVDDARAHIDVIEVEAYSTRSCGLGATLAVGGQPFSVGVGHAIVDSLVQALETTLTADAKNGASRYIFKSLGFLRQPDQENPCLLWLKR